MNTNLTRVQVYLDPENLALIDQMAKAVKVRRSQIIRDALDAVAIRYTKVTRLVKPKKRTANALLELSGIEKSKTGTIGLNVDEIYFND